MNKRVRTIIASFLFVTTLASCRAERDSRSNSTLVVGGVLSQTGPAAAYGSDADKGARLALERLSRDGLPFSIQYVSRDDRSDKTEAAKVGQSLIEIDHADIILGPAISPSALSLGKIAEERQVPLVGTSPTQDEVTKSEAYDRRYVFRVCFNDSFQGEVLARFAAERLGKKTAVIVYDKTLSYSIGLARTFREEFERLGGVIQHEENYSVQDTDYSVLIDKVANFKADVLFIPGWDENVGPMIKQAGDRWDRFTLLGGDAWPTPRFLELAGGNISDAYALSHFVPEDPDPRVQDFVGSYKKKYGEIPSPFAALGYDAMLVIVDAAKRSGSFDGPALRDALAVTNNLGVVTGNLSFDDSRNPRKEAVILRIHPDRFDFFERVEP